MEEKNNGLIVVAKTFFKKVKEFFFGLFKKEDEKIYEFADEEKKVETEKNDVTKTEDNLEEKEKFFEKYEAFKNEKIDVSELSGSELIKMNAMLEEEAKLNKQRLENTLNKYNKKNSAGNGEN